MRRTIQFSVIFLLFSCVGPFTPMGAINHFHKMSHSKIKLSAKPESITLNPRTIYFHKETNYIIKAKNEFAKEFNNNNWKIFYQGNDVSAFFEISPQSTKDEAIIESKEEFQLPYLPNAEISSELVVEWKSQNQTQAFLWPLPTCQVFFKDNVGRQNNLRSMGQFQEKAEIFTRLERAAKENNINPNFYAGILAAVSQMDSNTISENKKIGLAQIPFIEAILVSKDKSHWPKSKRIENSPTFLLRLLLNFSLIDSETDWRLNVEKSLLAGAEYLKYINTFWSESDYKDLPQNLPQIYSKIVAGSYILGPNAILDLYKTYGDKFEELNSYSKTRELVDLAFGHCVEFSSEKNENIAKGFL